MLPRGTDDAGQEATGNRLLGRPNASVDVTAGHTPLSVKTLGWDGLGFDLPALYSHFLDEVPIRGRLKRRDQAENLDPMK